MLTRRLSNNPVENTAKNSATLRPTSAVFFGKSTFSPRNSALLVSKWWNERKLKIHHLFCCSTPEGDKLSWQHIVQDLIAPKAKPSKSKKYKPSFLPSGNFV